MDALGSNPSGWQIAFIVLQIIISIVGFLLYTQVRQAQKDMKQTKKDVKEELDETQEELEDRMDVIESKQLDSLESKVSNYYNEFDKQRSKCGIHWDNLSDKLNTIHERLDDVFDAIDKIRDNN